MNIMYICGALFLLFFIVPAVGLFFAMKEADRNKLNDIDRDYRP